MENNSNLYILGIVSIVAIIGMVCLMLPMQKNNYSNYDNYEVDSDYVGNALAVISIDSQGWTQWLDRDNPSGVGDYELLADFKKTYSNMCSTPLDIQCQTTTGTNYNQTRQIVTCNKNIGLTCENAKNNGSTRKATCKDYKVKFKCPINTNTTTPICGNGQLNSNEICDPNYTLTNIRNCSIFMSSWTGTASCKADCTGYDTSTCIQANNSTIGCGNGQIEKPNAQGVYEQCDGILPVNLSCQAFGFQNNGTLSCNNCLIITSNCR